MFITCLELFNIALAMGYVDLIEWAMSLIEDSSKKKIAELSGELLYSACFNGEKRVLQWAINFLKPYPREYSRELNGTYKHFVYETTLLTSLCYHNEHLDTVELLLQSEFPQTKEMLLFKFIGKNALHLAIWYENLDMVKILLGTAIRRDIFLSAEGDFEGMSPGEFADKLQFHEISLYIADLETNVDFDF